MSNQNVNKQLSNDEKDNNFPNDIQMLNYYQNEFMFRHTNYWNLTIKFFLLSIIITILPLTNAVLGIEFKNIEHKKILFCFPILGLIIALLSFKIINEEAKRMNAINKAKYRINKLLQEKYQYEPDENNPSKKWLSVSIPKYSLLAEILVVICVILFIVIFY